MYSGSCPPAVKVQAEQSLDCSLHIAVALPPQVGLLEYLWSSSSQEGALIGDPPRSTGCPDRNPFLMVEGCLGFVWGVNRWATRCGYLRRSGIWSMYNHN